MLGCGHVHWRRALSIHYTYRAHKKVAHYNLLLLIHQQFVNFVIFCADVQRLYQHISAKLYFRMANNEKTTVN